MTTCPHRFLLDRLLLVPVVLLLVLLVVVLVEVVLPGIFLDVVLVECAPPGGSLCYFLNHHHCVLLRRLGEVLGFLKGL